MWAVLEGPTGYMLLNTSMITLGRARTNTVVLSDLAISARHAEVRVEGEHCWLVDLGSANGTFVNGQRLVVGEKYALQARDMLLLGETTLTFLWSNDVQPGKQEEGVTQTEASSPFAPTLAVPVTLSQAADEREAFLSAQFTQSHHIPLSPGAIPSPSVSPNGQPAAIPMYRHPITQPGYPSVFASSPPLWSWERFVALTVLILVLLLSTVGGALLVQHNHDMTWQYAQATASTQMTATAQAAPRATATALVTSPYPPFTHLTLFDSLIHSNQSDTNWDTQSGCQFTSYGYQINSAKKTNYDAQICMAKNTDFGDFAIQVTMMITQGNCGGMLFRSADFVGICQNGLVLAALGNHSVAIFSRAIREGEHKTNTLAIIVQGTSVRLFINEQPITKDIEGHPVVLTDTQSTHGSLGLFTLCTTYDVTTVTYTNALVWTIPM